MGTHMFSGLAKYDASGKVDLLNGKERPVSFEGISNSIIFTVFAFFNEEWDWFLFEQFPGCGILVVLWQILIIVIGLQILSKYFMASLMNSIGERLDQEK
jgi:hypothetical protein